MRRKILGLAMALAVSACTPHPVGPARTYDDYERKARTTVEAAQSSVETALLTIQADGDGHATSVYTASLLSEQEEGINGVTGTFESIQPPDERADALRGEVVDLLDAGLEHVTSARIIAHRGGGPQLQTLRPSLEDDAKALAAFLQEHGG